MTALTFYTGSDSRMLPQSFILLQSFKEHVPGAELVFCDFGLTPAQRRFLEKLGKVAGGPGSKGRGHVWLRKASLVDFFVGGTEAAVWIDADMLLLDDPRTELSAINEDMGTRGQSLAVCADFASMTLDRYTAWCGTVGAAISHFVRDLAQHRIAGTLEYLNSGFFIARSRRWLKDWRQAALTSDQREYLFEQNAFNVMAWRDPAKVRLLDLSRWNVHGLMLARLAVKDGKVTCYDRPVIGLHATSADPAYLKHERTEWAAGTQTFVSDLRLFTNPALRDIQRELFFRFVDENGLELAKIF